MRNRLFYFGSFERFADRRGSLANYGVPTAKMRTGDFSEVAAAYSGFRLYNPFTGARQRRRPRAVPEQQHPVRR